MCILTKFKQDAPAKSVFGKKETVTYKKMCLQKTIFCRVRAGLNEKHLIISTHYKQATSLKIITFDFLQLRLNSLLEINWACLSTSDIRPLKC